MFPRVCILAIAVSLSLPFLLGAAQAADRQTTRWQPAKLVPGSPVLFEVSASSTVREVAGQWLGHELTFFRAASGSVWYAIAGVSLETTPGTYTLRLKRTLATGKTIESQRGVRIVRAVYPRIPVKVAKQFTEPSAEQLKEISADKDLKQQIFAGGDPQKLWMGSFAPPVNAAVSDVFGTERVFNQEVQSRHQGLDYAVPAGTPVSAINRGTVLLARPLYFEGNCVVVDHGQGLLSLYLHLSELKVKEGDRVQGGQLVGLSGGTGRASGPHLHLAIRWQGVYLDPAILLKLRVP